jgi:hypothetical protein
MPNTMRETSGELLFFVVFTACLLMNDFLVESLLRSFFQSFLSRSAILLSKAQRFVAGL